MPGLLTLVRIQPQYGEGPNHYLMRLAAANGVSADKLADVGVGNGINLAPRNSLETCEANLWVFARIAVNRRLFPRAWLKSIGRVCPRCIAEGHVRRSVGWELRYADACITHKIWLVDRCACGHPIPPIRQLVDRCDRCARKLGSLNCASAPDAVIRLSEILIERSCIRAGEPTSPHYRPFVELPLDHLQDLIVILGLYGDPNAPLRRSGVLHVEHMNESWPIVTLAAEALADWPRGFHTLLHWLRTRNDDGTTFRLGQRFGRLYDRLYKGRTANSFAFVHRALEEYLAEHWPGAISLATGRLDLRGRPKRWMPANAVRERLGLSPRDLDELVRRGLLIAETRHTAKGRRRVTIDRGSVFSLESSQFRDRLDLHTASIRLGLGKCRLRSILTSIFPNAWRSSSGHWQIATSDIDNVLRISQDLVKMKTLDVSKITSIDGALRYLHLTDDGLVWIFRKVIGDTAHQIVGRAVNKRGIGAWVVPRTLVASAIKETEPLDSQDESSSLGLGEIAERWQVKLQVVYELVRAKAIQCTPVQLTGCRGRRVSIEEVKRFESGHITARQLAAHAACSPRMVVTRLERAGVVPKVVSSDFRCRQVYFARTDALQTALKAVNIPCSLDQASMTQDHKRSRQSAS
jgi:hypothetical protein